MVAMRVAHHLLQYDGHLLLVDDVLRGGHVGLGVAIVDRGIDALDGCGQHLHHGILVLDKRNHVGGIDAGKGLIVAVLEQRAGTDGDGTLHGLEEGEEVVDELVGQLRLEKVLQDFLIGSVAQRQVVEIVAVHELVEDVGAEHERLGDSDRDIVKLCHLGMPLDDVVEEGQAASLSAQRALADAGEVAVLVVLVAVELCHHTDILHVAVLHDGLVDNLAVGIHILQLVPGDVLQESRHGEDGPRRQPAAHMVARDVVEHGVVGNLEHVVLQLLQRMDAHDGLLRLWVAEDEIAESHVVLQGLAQVDVEGFRLLVDEEEMLVVGLQPVGRLRALHDERHELVFFPDGLQELETGIRGLVGRHSPTLHGGLRRRGGHREAGVGDDTEHILPVFLIHLHGLLVVAGQHHLWPAAHAERGLVAVERLSGEVLALLQNIVI